MTGDAVPVPDRRLWLLGRDATFNGVDFAAAGPGHHAQIHVHFINRVRLRGTLDRDRLPVTLAASGVTPDPVVGPVDEDADWSTDTSGRPVLRVTADIPDVPARYTLTVHSGRLDPCFRSAMITVPGRDDKADCGAQPTTGQLPGEPPVPIDYLSKDYASFCQALSDFSAARYPLWIERSEADFGVMLMEALSALADELSYLQDRVAAEATLGTATQRLSLVQLARLVDYEPAPAMAASTVLQFDVAPPPQPGGTLDLPDVIQCQAASIETGTVYFAAGWPPTDPGRRPGYPTLDARWNRYADAAGSIAQLAPYLWDPDATWLRQGATSMWIEGHQHGFYPGQELLIDTAGAAGGEPPVREMVRLSGAEEKIDPCAREQADARPVTLIRWSDGLASDHDLTRTQVAGNLVTAMQGLVTDEVFAIPGGAAATGASAGLPLPLATVRADHIGSPAHCLYTLAGPLAWQSVPATDGGPAWPRPAIMLNELADEPGGQQAGWQWAPRLLDADGTGPAFTVVPERYSPAEAADGLVFYDYDGDGATIRFGDGTFGCPPVPGTTFRARYLAGGGDVGNVAADTIGAVAPGDPANNLVWRCTNPFPATGGAAAETHAQIRDRVPYQVASSLLSLTGPADYEQAALSFSARGSGGAAWARQAIAAVRWTGSWPSTLTIADPAADEPRCTQRDGLAGLGRLLAARRLAGADTAVALARYCWLDLRVACAASAGSRPGDVVDAVIARLSPLPGADGTTGFFGRDKWTFGQPLEASALIAAIQSCPGVAGVTSVDYRRTPEPGDWRRLRATVGIAPREILRIDNDRDRPAHGLLFVTAEVAR